jgi:hypothetical protein
VFDSLSVNSAMDSSVDAAIAPAMEPGVDAALEPGVYPGVDRGVDPGLDPGVDRGVDPGVEAMRAVRAGMAAAILLERTAAARQAMADGFDLLAQECPQCSVGAERHRQRAQELQEQALRCRERALHLWIAVEEFPTYEP